MPKRALVLIDIQNDYFPGGKCRAGPRHRGVLEAKRLGATAGVQSDGFHAALHGSKGGLGAL